ncbi:MAG: beta-galactosidase [Anaerolineaceae bacterium]|nr:beta-galactosidase [Anaerolineaceae bacterium]
MKFGVCYYPEQWPAERWSADAAMMRAAGISLVRIGEFAWKQIEPTFGGYNWQWIDQVIETLENAELKIILGTPTAAPPAWICKAHPDIFPVDEYGRRKSFGSRRHYCPSNEDYRRLSIRIVNAMLERYGSRNSIIGWQVDNEFGDHNTARCYCDTCTRSFRLWLRKKYENIEALNQAWGTDFWSQAYRDWIEIDLPNLTVTEPNPSQMLDYYRFSSNAYVNYQQIQIDLIRQSAPGKSISTNIMGNFFELNHQELARSLDLVAWDNFPTGYADVHSERVYTPGERIPSYAYDVGDPYLTGFRHAIMYGLKQEPFWVMEQQCGNINWSKYNVGIRPGTTRLWTWHALSCGAEAVLYFRWRATRFAQQQYHSGLLTHDASEATGYQELRSMHAELNLMKQISSAPRNAKVALLMDYEDLWAIQIQPHHKDFRYQSHLFLYFRAIQKLGLTVDIVSREADLNAYNIVIAPSVVIEHQALSDKLANFVQQGGIVLLGIRSGSKTDTNLFSNETLPGVYQSLVGAEVKEWHALPPDVHFPIHSSIPDLKGHAQLWAEIIQPLDQPGSGSQSQILAEYTSGPFAGKAALTAFQSGNGEALYMGWYPTEQQAIALIKYLARKANIKFFDNLPDGLICIQRGNQQIYLNFLEKPIKLEGDYKTVNIGARSIVII